MIEIGLATQYWTQPAFMSELFATKVRGMALSIIATLGRTGGIIVGIMYTINLKSEEKYWAAVNYAQSIVSHHAEMSDWEQRQAGAYLLKYVKEAANQSRKQEILLGLSLLSVSLLFAPTLIFEILTH